MVGYQGDIGIMRCKIVDGIYHCMPVRDDINNPIYLDLPACLPQEFVKLRNQDFTILVNTQMTRLSVTKGELPSNQPQGSQIIELQRSE